MRCSPDETIRPAVLRGWPAEAAGAWCFASASEEATINPDEYGIPHVSPRRLKGRLFAVGHAQVEDRAKSSLQGLPEGGGRGWPRS